MTTELIQALAPLQFGHPVTHVYNPLEYARAPWERYLERYGQRPREIILLGMNPGPFGMAQTGIPFGEVNLVRDWLDLEAPVHKPPVEHAKRPVRGFACLQSEVSGRRLWGWARQRFGDPERFFARFFVANYCPLVFMSASGANLTPDKLPERETQPLFAACDAALRHLVLHFRPLWVLGVGGFAEERARAALASLSWSGQIGRILHPSPASPLANKDWAGQAEKQLRALGLI